MIAEGRLLTCGTRILPELQTIRPKQNHQVSSQTTSIQFYRYITPYTRLAKLIATSDAWTLHTPHQLLNTGDMVHYYWKGVSSF